MDLIPPTNWDDDLVDFYRGLGVKEVYGKLAVDFVGGGRSAYTLRDVSAGKAERHIRLLGEAGLGFNYVLNAPCLGSAEYTKSGRAGIFKLLDWLVDAGVGKVTVTIPYLLELIKARYPALQVTVSVFAGVDSVDKAAFWERLGADEITLLQTTMNRDFKALRLIRKKVKCRLRLIGNTSCLYQCPLIGYHAVMSSHASQSGYSGKAGLHIEYCPIVCKYMRLLEPVRFIKSNWIRPEDLHVYEELGIDGIKLVDRTCSTEQLKRIVEAYSRRRYDGNLIGLLPLFHRGVSGGSPGLSPGNLKMKAQYLVHPLESNVLALPKIHALSRDLEVSIDNRSLDGFIDKFLSHDCRSADCDECGYCGKVAEKAVKCDKRYLERMVSNNKKFIDDLAKCKY